MQCIVEFTNINASVAILPNRGSSKSGMTLHHLSIIIEDCCLYFPVTSREQQHESSNVFLVAIKSVPL